jgi:hypothetical protein
VCVCVGKSLLDLCRCFSLCLFVCVSVFVSVLRVSSYSPPPLPHVAVVSLHLWQEAGGPTAVLYKDTLTLWLKNKNPSRTDSRKHSLCCFSLFRIFSLSPITLSFFSSESTSAVQWAKAQETFLLSCAGYCVGTLLFLSLALSPCNRSVLNTNLFYCFSDVRTRYRRQAQRQHHAH